MENANDYNRYHCHVNEVNEQQAVFFKLNKRVYLQNLNNVNYYEQKCLEMSRPECEAFVFDDVTDPNVSSCFLGNNKLQTGR